MEAKGIDYLGVELKLHYFNEFILSGIPVPPYTKDRSFVLKFNDTEHYKSYTKLLTIIFHELELADLDNSKYEIQRSKIFIRNLLVILKEQASKINN